MKEEDILIIGGGIAGCATAFRLATLGHQVTLLEKGGIASQASGQNAGLIDGKGWGRKPDLEAYFGMGGLEIFKQLHFDLGYDIGFRQSGTFYVIHNEEQYQFARDRVLDYQANGYQAELLETREAAAIEPRLNPELAGVVYYPSAAQADPIPTTRAIADAATKNGANILTNQTVISIVQQADDSYTVKTATDTFSCHKLVLATGAWSKPVGEMLGLDIPVVPIRGQMWATEPLPPMAFHGFASAESWLAFYDQPTYENEPPSLTHRSGQRICRHLYGRQRANGEIIFGGDREMLGYNVTPDPAGIAINHTHASEALPFLKDLPIARTWAGLMPFTLDGKPLIGAIPTRKNLYYVGGLSSGGFSRGPMAGQLLADLIDTGHPHYVLAEADPAGRITELA